MLMHLRHLTLAMHDIAMRDVDNTLGILLVEHEDNLLNREALGLGKVEVDDDEHDCEDADVDSVAEKVDR